MFTVARDPSDTEPAISQDLNLRQLEPQIYLAYLNAAETTRRAGGPVERVVFDSELKARVTERSAETGHSDVDLSGRKSDLHFATGTDTG